MANDEYTQIRESLDRLVEEGCKYLYIVDYFYDRVKDDNSEFQRVLRILDIYIRSKSALQEDMTLLMGITNVIRSEDSDHDNYVDYDNYFNVYDDDSNFDNYDEEAESREDEETVSDGEYDNSDEWLSGLTSAIREKKNALMNMEITLLQKLESYSNLMEMQSQLNDNLQNYCERVVTVLQQITSVENQKKDTRLTNRFSGKQMKLLEILAHITERQEFVWGDHTSGMETV